MKVRIVGKNDCPWCTLAVSLAESNQVEYEYQKLYEDITVSELLEQAPGVSTVPQIFVDGEHIGGYQNFEKLMMERK